MASITYHAREATFTYATALTINTTGTLETIFAAATGPTAVGVIKDVTISPPEGDVDQVNYLGEDTNGFQNAEMEEKAFGPAEISGTMSVASGEVFETIAYGTGTATASSTYTRYQAGDGNRVLTGAILVSLDNGTNVMNVALNNLYFTKLGDIKPTGTDGHWEMEFTAKCQTKDYHEEFKD